MGEPFNETAESWSEAKHFVSAMGPTSALFFTGIRFLIRDAEAGLVKASPQATASILPMLRSRSFIAPLYFAYRCFRSETLEGKATFTISDVINCFKPDELAVLIGLLYLHRRIQKGCEPSEWAEIDRSIALSSEISGLVGQHISKIGFNRGLLVGALRPLASAVLLRVDKDRFKKYRRECKIKKIAFDLEQEMTLWGCNHMQVAVTLLQNLGLGLQLVHPLAEAFRPRGDSKRPVSEEVYALELCALWTEALLSNGKIPDIRHRGEYYPHKAAIDLMESRATQIKDHGSDFRWLGRGKNDLGPEMAPGLELPVPLSDEPSVENEIAKPPE